MIKNDQPPAHIAIIMDGNGRWAKKRFLPRVEGHRQGCKVLKEIIQAAQEKGVKYLTVYAFSAENWARPKAEVSVLMGLFETYLKSELKLMLENGIRLRSMGDTSLLSEGLQKLLKETEEETYNNTSMQLVLAVSYGSRQEIISAIKKIATKVESGKLRAENVSVNDLQESLYLSDVPDPDMLIRTSGESRLSNFMLWQMAYTEIFISKSFWPEFSKAELYSLIEEYNKRERRFGLTGDQLSDNNRDENVV